jgi:hypothetical protein
MNRLVGVGKIPGTALQRTLLSRGMLCRGRREGGKEETRTERRDQAHAGPGPHPKEWNDQKEALSKESGKRAPERARQVPEAMGSMERHVAGGPKTSPGIRTDRTNADR